MRRNKGADTNAKGFRRRSPPRFVPDLVLIVTEGSKTEPMYFEIMMKRLGISSAKITVTGDKTASSPMNVVDCAIRILHGNSNFDKIYCVFDRDCHSSYEEAIGRIHRMSNEKRYKGKNIYAITSIPCFEVWYLLHVSNSYKPYGKSGSPCAELIGDLRKIFPFENYDKSDCGDLLYQVFENQELAIKRAKQILSEAEKIGIPKFQEDPSTRVHEVVEELMKISEDQGNENT